MPADRDQQPPSPVELLHPFYLDTDMSMAFAAALAGGVALEREDVAHEAQESEAVRNLRGNLRLFGTLGLGAGGFGAQGERATKESELATTESRLIRHHTEASIFIALHDELRRTNRVADGSDVASLSPGELVSLTIGPAVAPLRRLVDQLIRLLDVAAPLVGMAADGGETNPQSRQVRRQQSRQASKPSAAAGNSPSEATSLDALRSLLVALKDDLDQSGMVDVVVIRDDAPSVILTLDKRFVSDQSLELLHTSSFTVVGKVTQVWSSAEEIVNLYRRSVIALIPALGQTVVWGMFTLLATLAGSLDPEAAEKAARAAGRVPPPDTEDVIETDTNSDPEQQPEIMLGDEAIKALNPLVNGPAVQVLPLAICT